MSEAQMLTLSASLVTVMFGLLCAILGWLGTRLHNKMDHIGSIIGGLFEKLNGIDGRLIKVETRCEMNHPSDK